MNSISRLISGNNYPLPVLTPEIADSIFVDMLGEDSMATASQQDPRLANLVARNPDIYTLITRLTRTQGVVDQSERRGVKRGMALTHDLVCRLLEATPSPKQPFLTYTSQETAAHMLEDKELHSISRQFIVFAPEQIGVALVITDNLMTEVSKDRALNGLVVDSTRFTLTLPDREAERVPAITFGSAYLTEREVIERSNSAIQKTNSNLMELCSPFVLPQLTI